MTETAPTRGRTLHVRYRQGDRHGLEETLEAIDRGETPEPHLENVYHDPADIDRVTRPNNLELLRAVARHEPESIRETARLVGRDVRQVHRNLTELEGLHLVNLEVEGRSKRPTVWYDTIEVDPTTRTGPRTRHRRRVRKHAPLRSKKGPPESDSKPDRF